MTADEVLEYNAALAKMKKQSCEYAYANLFAWQDAYDTQICFSDNIFYVKFCVDGSHSFLPPVGMICDYEKYIKDIIEYERKVGNKSVCFCGFDCSQTQLAERYIGKSVFYPERGNFDYLYEVLPLETFSGKKLHSKKNHLNKFLSLYGDRYVLEELNNRNAVQCIEFTRMWGDLNRSFDTGELSKEEHSAIVMLENLERLKLFGAVLKVDGKVCGYTIGESAYPDSDTVVIHIEKGVYDIDGVYQMLFSGFLKSLGGKYKYVNREDDVDDEGLRKSKLSYRPCGFVEKYSAEIEIN